MFPINIIIVPRYRIMETDSIMEFLKGIGPELILLIGGLIALLVVFTYVKDKESFKYKFFVAMGLIFGVLMIFLAVTEYAGWPMFATVVILVAAFALVIRPFRDVPFAVIFALFAMAIIYVALAQLAGTPIELLSEGWPRIIVAFIAGAIIFGILHFVESIVKLFGKLLNWWPLLMILGLVCIIEAILMLMGHGSLYDFIKEWV